MPNKFPQKTITKLPAFAKISEITIRSKSSRYSGAIINILFWAYKREYDTRRKNECFMSINKDGLQLHYIYGWNNNEYDVDSRNNILIIDSIDFA
jgi:hypothetical protein